MPQQPDQGDSPEFTPEFAEVNENLTRALKLCHSLVDDYRLKLAANSNELEPASDGTEIDTDFA